MSEIHCHPYYHCIHIPLGQIQIVGSIQFLHSLHTKYRFYLGQYQMKTRCNHQWIYIVTNRLPCLQRYQYVKFCPR